MARPRKNAVSSSGSIAALVEVLGEALGRGVAHGINSGLAGMAGAASTSNGLARRRGRPPKAHSGGAISADRRCKVDGCVREARSKGLCSAHYQADRRRHLGKA